MSNKKIFILLPDGIGLRNFVYTQFNSIGVQNGFKLTYWNNTPFDLEAIQLDEIKIQTARNHPVTEIYKNARKHVELNLFKKRFNTSIYDHYRFPFPATSFKQCIKTILTKAVITLHNSEKGLIRIRKSIKSFERKTNLYKESLKTLKKERPQMIFCTNQRPMTAIAPLLAAQDLGIPTVTFIFSWDNLPKATMVVETDYYFVWSNFMKIELLKYCSYIEERQVFVTGTPQFENHFYTKADSNRTTFFKTHGLDITKKYICFSGDDITTSPDDPQYLNDVAEAVTALNNEGYRLGIIFRRCPVDFSDRYDEVLSTYKGIIIPIAPLWEKMGVAWNTVLPTKEDLALQTDTICHTEFVINLGSSMVFDYALQQKKCMYINYDVPHKLIEDWSTNKIYQYIHFQSMSSKDAVVWINQQSEFKDKIEKLLCSPEIPTEALEWSTIILGEEPSKASEKIWQAIATITNS